MQNAVHEWKSSNKKCIKEVTRLVESDRSRCCNWIHLELTVIMDLGRYCHTPSYVQGKSAPTLDFKELPSWPFTQTTVLARSICHENPKHVRTLLKKGCSPNRPVGQEELRPLMIAFFMKRKEKRVAVVKCLFDYHVNAMLTDSKGRNCLMYACALALEEEVEYLINHFYFDFKVTDIHCNTVLHYCAMCGTTPVLSLVLDKMLRYSLSINGRNNGSHTPLDVAIIEENLDCMQLLHKAGGQCTLPKYRKIPIYFHLRTCSPVSTATSTTSDCDPPSLAYSMRIAADERARSEEDKLSSGWLPMFPPIGPPKCVRQGQQKRLCSEDILYRLLGTKAKQNTASYCRPVERVSLDSDWIKATQAYMSRAYLKKAKKLLVLSSSSNSSRENSD